jgi:hypothetical protein
MEEDIFSKTHVPKRAATKGSEAREGESNVNRPVKKASENGKTHMRPRSIEIPATTSM